MTALLALLLVMGLSRAETNVTVAGRQAVLRCHVCEEYNTLRCTNPTNCPPTAIHCVTAIVRVFVRYFYVSRQCTRFCPVITPDEVVRKPFVLVKPTPFLYAMCCRSSLCNTQAPRINDTEASYKEGGRAGGTGASAGLVLLSTLTSVSPALPRP